MGLHARLASPFGEANPPSFWEPILRVCVFRDDWIPAGAALTNPDAPRTWKTHHSGPSTFKHNLSTLERAQPYRAKSLPEIGSGALSKENYFGTPTNRAPVSLPSALMSGA